MTLREQIKKSLDGRARTLGGDKEALEYREAGSHDVEPYDRPNFFGDANARKWWQVSDKEATSDQLKARAEIDKEK